LIDVLRGSSGQTASHGLQPCVPVHRRNRHV
jgi:hypothetical protein